jgi:hypothetical protein
MPFIFCKLCGKEFSRKLSQINYAKESFCSESCMHKAKRNGQWSDCSICGKRIYRTKKFLESSKSGKFFCSKTCSIKWQNIEFTGERHPNWTTGEYSYKTVLKKTGLVQSCRRCGKTDSRILVVHHLDKNRQNNQAANLVWLCHNCHHLVHHYVGKEFLALMK